MEITEIHSALLLKLKASSIAETINNASETNRTDKHGENTIYHHLSK